MGLDNLSDTSFRLDCQAADPTCTAAAAASFLARQGPPRGRPGQRHRDNRGPFFLAARMRHAPGWHDLARPALLFGALFPAVLVIYAALEGKPGGGYLQRAAILLLSVGVVTLALRVRALAVSPTPSASRSVVE